MTTRGFAHAAPSTWNSLDLSVRSIPTLPAFKRHLKTYLLTILPPRYTHPRASDSPCEVWRVINCDLYCIVYSRMTIEHVIACALQILR